MTIESFDAALTDPLLLGAAIDDIDTWATWRTILRAAFGHPLTDPELDLLAILAGPNCPPPTSPVRELWVIAGRRSGKSRMAAAVASYVGSLDHRSRLAPGETGYIVVMSPTRDQSKAIANYIAAFFARSPILRQMVISTSDEEIELVGNIKIAVTTNSFRTIRSRTILLAVFDETAFWRDETSANPDAEVYRAVKPALIASGGMLLGISSPYRQIGLLHEKWRKYWNKESDHLIIRAPTTLLNPTIDPALIERERADDPESARAEWDAEWRTGISSLLTDDVIDDAIDVNRPIELPPRKNQYRYYTFVDASGGRHDQFAIAIGHVENENEPNERFVLDVIRGRKPPFDPFVVAGEYAALARWYGCSTVTGDAYGAEWVRESFEKNGATYRTSRRNKSELYLEMIAPFSRGLVQLPNDPILVRELRLLERRVARSGRDSVDHPTTSGSSDDRANALAGVLYLATNGIDRPVVMNMLAGR